MQGKELWERQFDAIIERELAKGSFAYLEGASDAADRWQRKDFGRNVRGLRAAHYSLSSRLGYEAGRRTAPEIGCPLHLDTNSEEVRLGLLGFYVGGADEILANHEEHLEHAIRIYQNLGLLGTNHAQRKLKRYAEKGPEHRTKLEVALRNLAVL
ncbi:hypothetical protein HYX05_01410 [Candidatus Woesearchaeota archaeon]|nr:hypothetical protein [Candidatus Woesearchaeota archaeon]